MSNCFITLNLYNQVQGNNFLVYFLFRFCYFIHHFLKCVEDLLRKLYTAPERDRIDYVLIYNIPKDPDSKSEVRLQLYSNNIPCYIRVVSTIGAEVFG